MCPSGLPWIHGWRPLPPGLASVAGVYGVTTTEALLVIALAEGQTLADFARERGSTELTARLHLKRVFENSRTTRQVDPVRLLLLGPGPHGLR